MDRSSGSHDPFDGHDRYVTVGERIGAADCTIPTCGLDWIPTQPPVELSEWPAQRRRRRAVHERGELARARSGRSSTRGGPTGCGCTSSVASSSCRERTPARASSSRSTSTTRTPPTAARLEEAGWKLADPRAAAGDPWRYRDYVQRSAAELMVAKNLYVDTRSGWFSDRSACYLASGRPGARPGHRARRACSRPARAS